MTIRKGTPACKAGVRSDFSGEGSLFANSAAPTSTQFSNASTAALALLNGGFPLTRKAGSFLGQLVVDPTPLSAKQAEWLERLLEKHGLPFVANGEAL